MQKILIENTQGIRRLEFTFPDSKGVFLLVGPNGAGKTTLLTCMERICNPLAFARGFITSRSLDEVDQFENAAITYFCNEVCVRFRKKTAKWAPSPKKGSVELLGNFGFPEVVFIRADARRIDINQADLRAGDFVSASQEIKNTLNTLMETRKYSNLMRLRNRNGRGRQATYYYVIRESTRKYYSEKRFSTGELALLRLVEKLESVEENTLVLLDEAEMALHPRVQVNLINYLQQKVRDKHITVFVSTHSPTMIKTISKENMMMLNDTGNGIIDVAHPCYAAAALGCVDFESSTIFDYIFFVEDDIARSILKKLLNKYITMVPAHATALSSIIPVGGFAQTAQLAVNTHRQVFAQSRVFAIVDQDAFDDIDQKPVFKSLYESNPEIIRGFGFTPEVFVIQQLETPSEQLKQMIRDGFHSEITPIIQRHDYCACNAQNPRKLAKAKFEIVVGTLCESSGDSMQLVIDRLMQSIVDDMPRGEVSRIMGPILRR